MTRQLSSLGIVLSIALLTLASGCQPQQPFYFFEDGDLSQYIDAATEIDYPDLETVSLDEVNGAIRPLTLDNPKPEDIWELSLEQATQIALCNAKVIRNLGGIAFGSTGSQGVPNGLLSQPAGIPSVYGPALQEADPTVRGGVAQALSAFDTQFATSVFWEKNDLPQNIAGAFTQFRPSDFTQDLGSFQTSLVKTAATGGTWSVTHSVDYEQNNIPVFDGVTGSRLWASDWNVNVEAEFRQPLMQGTGVQFNRIAGPGGIPGFNNGVAIARIRTDQSLADFEASVRDLVRDVETAYWELYYAYRSLDAAVAGRDAVLQLWRERKAEEDVGKGGRAEEAQARNQYFLFRAAAERAQSNLYKTENHLRYIIGLAATDGRLVRPANEPTTADIDFDWCSTHAESMARNVELRKQKWTIKQRELELIAAKNYLLPQLDAVGRYRWRGLGDRLIDSDNSVSNAYGSMTGGNYQEWHLGLDLVVPLGFRKEMAGVRYAQLSLARERAVFQEQELELSHQLSHAFRDLSEFFVLSQTNFNRRVAARDELETTKSKWEYGQRDITFAQVLDAQRRLAEAEIDYFRSLVDYNLGITEVHYRKGSLLEYNGVYLAEGPWPGKAYFDAHRRARARDASFYLDYGFTRPKVVSRGAYEQQAGGHMPMMGGEVFGPELMSVPGQSPVVVPQEVIPTPDPLPMKETAVPTAAPAGNMSKAEPVRKSTSSDISKFDLAVLAAKSPTAGPPVEASEVEQVSYQQPASEGEGGQARRFTNTWTSTKRPGTRHESVASSSSVEADGTASGWKRVQH